MYFVAVLAAISACFLPYLCSKQQQLIAGLNWYKSASIKRLCWLGFWLLTIGAAWLLSATYTAVVASLHVLFIVMSFSCVLSLCAAHWPQRVATVMLGLGGTFMALALLGGAH